MVADSRARGIEAWRQPEKWMQRREVVELLGVEDRFLDTLIVQGKIKAPFVGMIAPPAYAGGKPAWGAVWWRKTTLEQIENYRKEVDGAFDRMRGGEK